MEGSTNTTSTHNNNYIVRRDGGKEKLYLYEYENEENVHTMEDQRIRGKEHEGQGNTIYAENKAKHPKMYSALQSDVTTLDNPETNSFYFKNYDAYAAHNLNTNSHMTDPLLSTYITQYNHSSLPVIPPHSIYEHNSQYSYIDPFSKGPPNNISHTIPQRNLLIPRTNHTFYHSSTSDLPSNTDSHNLFSIDNSTRSSELVHNHSLNTYNTELYTHAHNQVRGPDIQSTDPHKELYDKSYFHSNTYENEELKNDSKLKNEYTNLEMSTQPIGYTSTHSEYTHHPQKKSYLQSMSEIPHNGDEELSQYTHKPRIEGDLNNQNRGDSYSMSHISRNKIISQKDQNRGTSNSLKNTHKYDNVNNKEGPITEQEDSPLDFQKNEPLENSQKKSHIESSQANTNSQSSQLLIRQPVSSQTDNFSWSFQSDNHSQTENRDVTVVKNEKLSDNAISVQHSDKDDTQPHTRESKINKKKREHLEEHSYTSQLDRTDQFRQTVSGNHDTNSPQYNERNTEKPQNQKKKKIHKIDETMKRDNTKKDIHPSSAHSKSLDPTRTIADNPTQSCLTSSERKEDSSESHTLSNIIKHDALKCIFTELDPDISVDDDVIEVLTQILQHFIHSVIEHSYSIARHRNSKALQATDLWFHLKKDWQISFDSFPPLHTRGFENLLSNLTSRSKDSVHTSHLSDVVNQHSLKLHNQLQHIFNEQAKYFSEGTIPRHRVRTSHNKDPAYQHYTLGQPYRPEESKHTTSTKSESTSQDVDKSKKVHNPHIPHKKDTAHTH